uniref:B229_C3_239 n=1 Tax=Mycobacterium leprae TaxID=1769 RepID=Q49870_MYCLR|nr:B229_C3_239 [Mycobacterium leprae]
MRHYYSVAAIRDAEASLLASLPDGVLMKRAAYGLASVIIRELAVRTGGVTGRRVCAVVGSGDNGGESLWAATFLRRAVRLPMRCCSTRIASTARHWLRSGKPAVVSSKMYRQQLISLLTGWWASPARGRCDRRLPRCLRLSQPRGYR